VAKWYVIHTLSGSEKRVKQMIFDQAAKKSIQNIFEDILIPVIEVPEVKKGKVGKAEKKIMPGYILLKMNMTDEAWHLVKSVPKITGFLGSKSTPQALTDKEVENIFSRIELETKGAVVAKLYDIGEQIIVTDGPFDTFTGVVEDIDNDKKRLKVSISIFGKATPIELSFTQVKKNN